MPKVIFTKPYDYFPSKEARVIQAYKVSKKPQAVNQECADRAIAAGVASLVEKPDEAETKAD